MSNRTTRTSFAVVLTVVTVLTVGSAIPRGEPGARDPDAGKIVVYRDSYGIPHIFAPTMAGGLYAMGWCQAEDRLEELLKNYLRAIGEMAAAFGPDQVLNDVQSRLWRHYEIARDNYGRIQPTVRIHMEAFVRGINDYLDGHPEQVPSWWGKRKVDAYMTVAFSRHFMWGWPTGQAIAELRRAGVTPSLSVDFRSSNEMAIAPSRTAVHAPILIIDPHLSWWGEQRFWEFRIHAGELHGSGFTLPGTPYVGLGHNDHVAWAMTTGGPDTADIYILKLNPSNPMQYQYDGGWRSLTSRQVAIKVKGEDKPREMTLYDSHYGPVAARKGNQAFAAKLAYADEVRFCEAFYYFNVAKDVADFRKGLDLNQLMPQNVMVADTGGNIYYQRTGRVPIRPEGFDFSQPVDGSTSRSEWLGIHPARDLISLENPRQGYMQNCNVAPDVMMVDSPLVPEKWKSYLFNETSGRIHQRGARAVQLLQENSSVTIEQAKAIALDVACYQYQHWSDSLRLADARFGENYRGDADYASGLNEILAWNGRSESDSRGALKYYYWRQAVRASLGKSYPETSSLLTDYMEALGKPKKEHTPLSDADLRVLASALQTAMKTMRQNHGKVDVSFGDVFRVGRDDKSWPVGGGSLTEEGMATLRAIGFGQPKSDHTRWGQSGQTSTQVVVLSKTIQSWSQPPIGESDRPDSPFYSDQAEKLFSPARMKPTWYQKSDLLKHVTSRRELNFVPSGKVGR